jgi:hypothetical protein
MRVLVNCSNHPSSSWTPEQKNGWDEIIDIPFPSVSPDWDTNDKPYQETIQSLWRNIVDVIRSRDEGTVYLYLAGEYSACFEIFVRAKEWLIPVVVPTTRRETAEVKNADGSVTKISKFEFVSLSIMQTKKCYNKKGKEESRDCGGRLSSELAF